MSLSLGDVPCLIASSLAQEGLHRCPLVRLREDHCSGTTFIRKGKLGSEQQVLQPFPRCFKLEGAVATAGGLVQCSSLAQGSLSTACAGPAQGL